jgi:Domain of unknown function (DUF4113)
VEDGRHFLVAENPRYPAIELNGDRELVIWGVATHCIHGLRGDIVANAKRQQSILAGIDDERRLRAMRAVDEINRRHGRHTVRPLAGGAGRGWDMRRQWLSPRYTTRLDEVLRVKAC